MIRLLVEPEAELDIAEAYDWYENHQVGLGERFLSAVRESLDRIQANPTAYPIVERRVRRALLRTFPCAVLYRDELNGVVVIACFHGKRNPAIWQRRV